MTERTETLLELGIRLGPDAMRLLAAIAELEATIERLQADGELLDWADENSMTCALSVFEIWNFGDIPTTLRTAIDAARAESQGRRGR